MGTDILVFLEGRDGAIHKSAWQAATTAKRLATTLGGRAVGVALGPGLDGPAAAQAGSYGVELVRHCGSDQLTRYCGEAYSRVLAAEAKRLGAAAVLVPATAMGMDLAPRVAARLETGVVADVTALEVDGGAFTGKRPVYAGKLFERFRVNADGAVISLRPNVFAAEEVAGAAAATVEPFEQDLGAARDAVSDVQKSAAGVVDVAEADIVVGGGRGLGDNENFERLIIPLAQTLGAAHGASRAIVDAGWRPHGEQVGQTGKTVSPRLYVAVGISGAIQHKAGMDSSKCIVAINKDPEAPIFKFADYGIVGDANEVVPRLTEELKSFLS